MALSSNDIKVSIIRRTTYKNQERPYAQEDLGNGKHFTMSADEVYDFTKKEHRLNIINEMANAVHTASNYDMNAVYTIIDEMKQVITEMEDELPFR